MCLSTRGVAADSVSSICRTRTSWWTLILLRSQPITTCPPPPDKLQALSASDREPDRCPLQLAGCLFLKLFALACGRIFALSWLGRSFYLLFADVCGSFGDDFPIMLVRNMHLREVIVANFRVVLLLLDVVVLFYKLVLILLFWCYFEPKSIYLDQLNVPWFFLPVKVDVFRYLFTFYDRPYFGSNICI